MRIDGLSSSYLPQRGARAEAAVQPFGQVQREVGARAESSANPPSGSSGELLPALAKVAASSAGAANYAARRPEQLYQAPLHNQVAQALASYTSTASFVTEGDAYQVMGLDLYA
jgi:hypothetical protein